jgi:glycosyltransferase involved in cell wall biosynthesis
MFTPLVSIMIPTYNQPQYILQAVNSALAQDYENLEVIVSDDSNNNATTELLRPLGEDKRLTYYKNPVQLGRVANYRRLLNELARGEWVIMLDGDDYFTDNSYIKNAVALIREHGDIVLVGARMQVLHEDSPGKEDYGLGSKDMVFDGKELFYKYKHVPAHQTDIYPRALAMQLDFYRDPSTASDSESLYRLCLHGRVAYCSKTVAVWRVHQSNTTYTRNLGRQIRELVFIDSVYKYARKYLEKPVADTWRRNTYTAMCAHLLHLAFTAKQYRYVVMIVLRYGRFMGWKLSLVYLLQIAGFYRQPTAAAA